MVKLLCLVLPMRRKPKRVETAPASYPAPVSYHDTTLHRAPVQLKKKSSYGERIKKHHNLRKKSSARLAVTRDAYESVNSQRRGSLESTSSSHAVQTHSNSRVHRKGSQNRMPAARALQSSPASAERLPLSRSSSISTDGASTPLVSVTLLRLVAALSLSDMRVQARKIRQIIEDRPGLLLPGLEEIASQAEGINEKTWKAEQIHMKHRLREMGYSV